LLGRAAALASSRRRGSRMPGLRSGSIGSSCVRSLGRSGGGGSARSSASTGRRGRAPEGLPMRLGRSRFGRQERGAELRSGRARTKRASDVLPGAIPPAAISGSGVLRRIDPSSSMSGCGWLSWSSNEPWCPPGSAPWTTSASTPCALACSASATAPGQLSPSVGASESPMRKGRVRLLRRGRVLLAEPTSPSGASGTARAYRSSGLPPTRAPRTPTSSPRAHAQARARADWLPTPVDLLIGSGPGWCARTRDRVPHPPRRSGDDGPGRGR